MDNKKISINETLDLLNLNAYKLYFGNIPSNYKSFSNNVKGSLLSVINAIQRVILGTFNCDLWLETIDEKLFQKMFPNACKIFSENNKVNFEKMIRFLVLVRDLNAHAFGSSRDKMFLKEDFSFLDKQPKFNKNINYANNGTITIAGIIFVVLNFLRAESIKRIEKDNYITRLIANGTNMVDDGKRFVNEISFVDLEVNIRQKTGEDLETAIFGEFLDKGIKSNDTYSLAIGHEELPSYKFIAELNNDVIKVFSESLTKTYYHEDYVLKIKEKEEFIKLANLLPPFVLVDYLYEAKIEKFDKKALKLVTDKFEIIRKLNKPKFYGDKNINLLLMDSNHSADYRNTSTFIFSSLSKIILDLEEYIYRSRKISGGHDSFSTIYRALTEIGAPSDIINELIILRNFCFHGFALNEHMITEDGIRLFSLEYVIGIFAKLEEFLVDNWPDIAIRFIHDKNRYFLSNLLKVKYKAISDYSEKILKEYPNYDKEILYKKTSYIDHSFFDTNIFNKITDFSNFENRVLKMKIPKVDYNLYLLANGENMDLLNEFLLKNGLKIEYLDKNNLEVNCRITKS